MTTREMAVWTGRVGGLISARARAKQSAEHTARIRWAFEGILRANPQANFATIAAALNEHGLLTMRGTRWTRSGARLQILRMGLKTPERCLQAA
jgi:hypothetical protein